MIVTLYVLYNRATEEYVRSSTSDTKEIHRARLFNTKAAAEAYQHNNGIVNYRTVVVKAEVMH